MDKETLIEALKQKALDEYKSMYSPKVDECIGFDCGFDAAFSLLQWKEIKSEDDLPKAEGWYIVMHDVGFTVPETAWWEESESDQWERTYRAYIPVPLPEYVKGAKQ